MWKYFYNQIFFIKKRKKNHFKKKKPKGWLEKFLCHPHVVIRVNIDSEICCSFVWSLSESGYYNMWFKHFKVMSFHWESIKLNNTKTKNKEIYDGKIIIQRL